MIDTLRIICPINIENVHNVAGEELGKKLSKKELKVVENKLWRLRRLRGPKIWKWTGDRYEDINYYP